MPVSILKETPVVLLIFNRPDATRRVFEAVRQSRPPKLLVVADGPREDRPEETELCRNARSIVDDVDWHCDVLTEFSDSNLGCKERIFSGLDWAFSQVDKAIILEDDCLPHATFFPYCEELLKLYQDDERVHMIRGGNFLGDRQISSSSYYFSRWYHIWGWATWARAWACNDVDMCDWPDLKESGWLESLLPSPSMIAQARETFDDSYEGRIDTWEYHWVFSGWVRNAFAICPKVNLVTNIGFGPDGTHLQDDNHPHSELPISPMNFPLKHPAKVEVDDKIDRLEWELLNPQAMRQPLGRRIARKIRNALRA